MYIKNISLASSVAALIGACTPTTVDLYHSNTSMEQVVVDLSEVNTGKIHATYRGEQETLILDMWRGPAVDISRLPSDIEVPEYIVYLEMHLSSGQMVFTGTQTDLPTVADNKSMKQLIVERGGVHKFDGLIKAVDSRLLADGALALADTLDEDVFGSEILTLENAAESFVEDAEFTQGEESVQPRSSVSCSGEGCTGKDPSSTNCDASAITSTFKKIGWWGNKVLRMRYSNDCKTNWGRFSSNWPNTSYVCVQEEDEEESGCSSHTGTVNWSDMLYCPTGDCEARATVVFDGTTYVTIYK